MQKNFQGAEIVSAYEAGFCGFALHRKLEDLGIVNRIVHPAGIEVMVRERVKHDRMDSEEIATQLSDGRLKGLHVPSEKREGYREVSRLREVLVRKKNIVSNQIKSLLHRQGLFREEDNKILSQKRVRGFLEEDLPGDIKYCLSKYCEEWLRLVEEIKEINKKLEEQSKEDGLEQIYRSLPGVGQTSARVLANELGDMSQFSNERKLFSYTGFTPREHASGEHRWQGHISRQGKPILRKILVQAAWRGIREDEGLEKRFTELSKRVGARKAIVAIARILIGYGRSCFKENRLYEKRSAH